MQHLLVPSDEGGDGRRRQRLRLVQVGHGLGDVRATQHEHHACRRKYWVALISVCVCVGVRACVNECVCACVHACVRVCGWAWVCAFVCLYFQVWLYFQVCLYCQVHTCKRAHVCGVCVCACVRACVCNIHRRIYLIVIYLPGFHLYTTLGREILTCLHSSRFIAVLR